MLTMSGIVTRFTNGNQPINRFTTKVILCVAQVMNLCCHGSTVYTTPMIPFMNDISFSLLFRGLEIYILW